MVESIKFFVKNIKRICGLIQRIFHGLASFANLCLAFLTFCLQILKDLIPLDLPSNSTPPTLNQKDFQLNYILKTSDFAKSSSYDWCNSYFDYIVSCFLIELKNFFFAICSHSCPTISLRTKNIWKVKNKYIVSIWKKWEILYYLKEKFIKLNVCCFFFYSSKSK